jgi:hypothetical protein
VPAACLESASTVLKCAKKVCKWPVWYPKTLATEGLKCHAQKRSKQNRNSYIKIKIPMQESKIQYRKQNQNRNSEVDIETKIKILIWTLKSKLGKLKHQNFDEIRRKFCQNFDFVKCIISKSKLQSQFWIWNRKQYFKKLKHRNFDKIKIKFR